LGDSTSNNTMTIQDIKSKLNNEEQIAFESILTKREFKTGDILIRENTIADKIFFIEHGACRSYFIKDSDEITDFFFFDGDFATDFASFCSGKPSLLNLSCIEDTVVLEMKKNDLEKLYRQSITFSEIGRLTAEFSFLVVEERMRQLHSESLEVKYNWMLKNFPLVFQRVPQYYIASFLGVKPQSLSRIRAKISGKTY
jgi:CRP-like cAMP-binding protein